MKFTEQTPKTPGFYWVKQGKVMTIIQVRGDMRIEFFGHNIDMTFEDIGYHTLWSVNPIDMPVIEN